MKKLSDFLIEKAKIELGEDENRKVQSIQQFRDWLSKHPFIKCPEIDETFLLKYLRAKKYSMPRVFESFEKHSLYTAKILNFLTFDENEYDRMMKLYESGIYYLMKNRDKNGAQIVVMRCKRIEEMKLSLDDFYRVHSLIYNSIENDEETQITGIICVIDCRGVSLSIFNSYPPKYIIEDVQITGHSPNRVKSVYLIGLPSFATSIYAAGCKIISNKLRDRLRLLRDEKELHELIDSSLLIEDLGGKLTETECVEEFRGNIEKNYKFLSTLKSKFSFDMNGYEKYSNDFINVGSFRKLEID